jgi:hypothetical protein
VPWHGVATWGVAESRRGNSEDGWFYSDDYDPNIYTLKAEIFGPYPPRSGNEPIWYFGGDSLRFWTVKVEVDTTKSSMLFEVPLEGEESIEDTAQTVFMIRPDTMSFESPVMDSLKYFRGCCGIGPSECITIKEKTE